MSDLLPPELASGSIFQDREYAWKVANFPSVLGKAAALGFACLGGQFQFRLGDGAIHEFYWLAADTMGRQQGETWEQYARRSCQEVGRKYEALAGDADFAAAAKEFESLVGNQPLSDVLFFNPFFAREQDF